MQARQDNRRRVRDELACHENDDLASHVKLPTRSSITWHEKTMTEAIVFSWWTNGDSNPRPLPCKGNALPTELLARSSLSDGLSLGLPMVVLADVHRRSLRRQAPARATNSCTCGCHKCGETVARITGVVNPYPYSNTLLARGCCYSARQAAWRLRASAMSSSCGV